MIAFALWWVTVTPRQTPSSDSHRGVDQQHSGERAAARRKAGCGEACTGLGASASSDCYATPMGGYVGHHVDGRYAWPQSWRLEASTVWRTFSCRTWIRAERAAGSDG